MYIYLCVMVTYKEVVAIVGEQKCPDLGEMMLDETAWRNFVKPYRDSSLTELSRVFGGRKALEIAAFEWHLEQRFQRSIRGANGVAIFDCPVPPLVEEFDAISKYRISYIAVWGGEKLGYEIEFDWWGNLRKPHFQFFAAKGIFSRLLKAGFQIYNKE